MMFRVCIIVIASLFISMAQAQTDPRKIRKQAEDPATKERAAKADRHVSKSKSIYDSANIRTKKKICH